MLLCVQVDITKVTGTGKDGRILKEDVMRYLDIINGKYVASCVSVCMYMCVSVCVCMCIYMSICPTLVITKVSTFPQAPPPAVSTPSETPPTTAPITPTAKVTILTEDKVVPITGFKRTMVKTMTRSGEIPQFGYCDEINMDAIVK